MFKYNTKIKTLAMAMCCAIDLSLAQPKDPIEDVALSISKIDVLIDNNKKSQNLDELSLAKSEHIDSSDIDAWTEAEKRSYNSVSGLELRAGYDRKFGDGTDDVYDNLYSYKNRFNAMLSWNILQSGLIGRSPNNARVELESQKLLLDECSALNVERIRTHSYMQEQIIDGYYNKIYSTQVELYTSLASLYKRLHYLKQATTMELSQIEMQIDIAKGAIRETPIKAEKLFDLQQYISTQVYISTQMIESLTQNSATIEKNKIEEQIITNKESSVNYWKGASLSPYAKVQQYTNDGFTTMRATANIGISATLPLFSGTRGRRAAIQAQSTLASNSTTTASNSLTLVISDIATQLNKNLERLLTIEKLERLYREQITEAQKAYKLQQLTMQELTQYYTKLLSLHSEILEIIEDRESLKTKLLLTTI